MLISSYSAAVVARRMRNGNTVFHLQAPLKKTIQTFKKKDALKLVLVDALHGHS